MDIGSLIPQFGNILYTLGAFVIALSVIVTIHEYGHYIVGRWSGIHAEVFSLGFGPVLYSRVDKRGTKWQIAALPLGGFVKFLGDSDAASGKDGDTIKSMTADERRRTMHGAPLWARAATVAAGPVFNFILSILVFGALVLARGTASEPLTIAEVYDLPAAVSELQPGDEILSIAGQPTPAFDGFGAFVDGLPEQAVLEYVVKRDGREISIVGPFPFPPRVSVVQPQSAAKAAGIQDDDVILAIDSQPVTTFDQMREIVGNSDGEPMVLDIWRAGETLSVKLTPRRVDMPLQDGGFETRWLLGISGGLFFVPQTERPGLIESVTYGVDQTIFIVKSSLSGLYHMVTGAISSCNLRGPLGIAETSGAAASQGIETFIFFIGVLSAAVGLLNLFPIPILDGGHLVFHAYEAVSGKPPSDRALRWMMTIGLVLLGALMVFALTNDLFCP